MIQACSICTTAHAWHSLILHVQIHAWPLSAFATLRLQQLLASPAMSRYFTSPPAVHTIFACSALLVVKHTPKGAQHFILLCLNSGLRVLPCTATWVPVQRGPCSRPAPAGRRLIWQGQCRLPRGAARHAGAAALPGVCSSLRRGRLQPLPAGPCRCSFTKSAVRQLHARLLQDMPLPAYPCPFQS